MSSNTPYEKEIKSEEWSEKDFAELFYLLLVTGRIIAGNLAVSLIALYFWPTILSGNNIFDKMVVVFIGVNAFAAIFWLLFFVLTRKKRS